MNKSSNTLKNEICTSLVVNPSHLKHVEMSLLSNEQMDLIDEFTFPSFCYDNALFSSQRLELNTIVYGVGSANIAGNLLHAEHCWLKDDNGNYYDPTYQASNYLEKTIYHSLVEIPITEYEKISKEILGETVSKISGLDFFKIRKLEQFKTTFKHTYFKRLP